MKTSIDSTLPANAQHEASAALLNTDSEAPTPVVNGNHDSPLSRIKYGANIKYGVGMLAFMAIPPLIPGVTTRIIIISFMCVIVSIYTAAAVMAAIRARHPAPQRKMT